MKTKEQFRREWILNPSKEMIVESEIEIAYEDYKISKHIKNMKGECHKNSGRGMSLDSCSPN